MAKCKICNREMLAVNGCTVSVLFQNGKKYRIIRVGDPEDWKPVKKASGVLTVMQNMVISIISTVLMKLVQFVKSNF